MNQPQGSPGHLQDGPTATRPTYRLIQVLRAVAAMMVVVHHSTIVLHEREGLSIWVSGASGVDIFFVISGFVMTISSAPLLAAKHPGRTFLARRLERVVPLYWIATTAKVLLLLFFPAVALNGLGGTRYIVGSYLFFPVINRAGIFEPVLLAGWTLNYEIAFYALFALALIFHKRVLILVAPALFAFGVLGLLRPAFPHTALGFYTNSMVLEFLFGMLLALGVRRVQRIPFTVAMISGTVGFAILCSFDLTLSTFRGLVWGDGAVAIVIAALATERNWGHRVPRWALELGDASYSIYLFHGFALPAVGLLIAHFGTNWPGAAPVCVTAMVLLSTACGELVYRTIERPITQRFKGRRRTAIPANA